MQPASGTRRFVFPRWANYLLPAIVIVGAGAGLYIPVLLGLAGSPRTTDVGYAPVQPVAFSHATHAGRLGIDCAYCHNTVFEAAYAAIPPTQTCLNCHAAIQAEHSEILKVRESAVTGMPIEWVRVHNLPDHAYFDHSAHVNKGIGCVSCHGRIDRMEIVAQAEPLSMGWCLECHREPERFLRPVEEVTNMAWEPPDGDQLALGRRLKELYEIREPRYMSSCTRCHR